VDIFTAFYEAASKGDFIKDMSPQRRSMGYVVEVTPYTNMMRVRFPKATGDQWVVWKNHGHYRVIK